MELMEGGFDGLNLLALVWFLLCLNGYAWFAAYRARTTPCLASVLHLYRTDWMRRMLSRDTRIADTSVIANLERGVAFFASSTMLVLAGLLTVLGASEEAIAVVSDLPLVSPPTKLEWELKLLVLIGLFVYAFFKFTWSLRQYGFCSVLIGSAPTPQENPTESERHAFTERSARIISMAANNFNFGLRACYFSLALLGWFINAWVMMLLCAGVVYVLYHREFRSSTLRTLKESVADGATVDVN
ncbi:DUF599 domain-containing protein [Motiliproteus sp. SC1-56]|uniref:DUF599 domain-containing protein n=1 Tax=Motiliproteus sp. SC1-56 TaxID=2799565 RepID=UPI001A8EFA56|nr:DUF599 family protein [Motiliproteus sp. SC1-56]